MSPASSDGRASRSTEATGIDLSSTAGTIERCHASWSCSRSTLGGSAASVTESSVVSSGAAAAAAGGGGRRCGVPGARADRRYARLELLEPVRRRLAREVGRGPRHLHERELERQARVAALAHVLDGHGQQVDEPQHRRRRQLVRLLAQPVAGLLGHRQRLGHLAEVLDEHEVAQVLEQVGDEPPEVLAVLRELLEVGERAGRVAVDDEVADAEERLLLDRAEHLEHVLDGDLRRRLRPRAGRGSTRRRGRRRARRGR